MMEAGKVEAKPTDFAVGNLFAALRGMLRPLLLNQSVDLVFEDASSIPGLYTDEGKVSQILRNFISNALKFTERGEVRVVAELVGDHEVIFRVADTGIGIDARDQEAIFQDFVQLDHPIQRRVKGTGLGLPLSRKLAIFLGGSVEVSSQPGKGSVFLLRIPVHYADPHEPGLVLEDWVPDPNCLPVLFVEDSPESLLTYKSFLRHTDFQVVAAATTRDAATILERVTPRAIVLDMILRPEDTWTLLANLKQNPAAKNIPVAIVSTIDDRAKAFHLGASACLIKPVSRADLLGELRALTGIPAINRILIIDDNELDRYLMKQHLKNLPLSLIEADCGTGGIRRACEYRPDLIFLDLSMPDMTGFEVLDQLKEKPESKFIPVVIVSSLILTGEERRRLMEKAVTIMGKDGLTDKAVADVLRRTLNIEEAPAKASQ
jgi:CheY-like chemotaxis protein/anti-sigma regulatory factor (Ser/Thr protein kinase)